MEQQSVDALSAYVARVDRHLNGVESHLRHLRHRVSACAPLSHSTLPPALPPARSSASEQRFWPSAWRKTSGSAPAREGARASGNRRKKGTPTSASSSSPASLSPLPVGGTRTAAAAAHKRFPKPLQRRQPPRLSSGVSALLSSSSSTLLSSSSSSSSSSSVVVLRLIKLAVAATAAGDGNIERLFYVNVRHAYLLLFARGKPGG
ncbi:uncharacterized protein Tco025E_04869 [Trypanosoma conorhini]|uniref:Uncharacterized protein n=1 Tax=Trypanosoma conorhini TaxID=83891 RepID=A0A422PI69_9TRYP|nr:uncharacterized protein Tco025E_04869 [Trypanosoma conorhini]RNF17414.1 hypothetical protein Tco025E_04869 [Trypanosoma conorhini]